MLENIGGIGYAVSAISYLIFAALLFFGWRGRLEGGLFITTVIFQLSWSAVLSLHMFGYLDARWLFLAEILRDGSWLLFFYRLLPMGGATRKRLDIFVYVVLVLYAIIAIGLIYFDEHLFFGQTHKFIIFSSLAFSVGLFVLVEQFFRNVKPEERWAIKFLCIGAGLLFVYDIYLYSYAALFSNVDISLWEARGYVNALVVPLLVLAVNRINNLSFEIFISRQVVFYSTGIFVVSVYLVLVSIGGIYIASFGGSWNTVAQVVFFVLAIIVIATVVGSEQARARIKVFVTKNFYRNRFDYREEWLRLIHNLSEYSSFTQFKEQVIQSMAVLIYSRGGVLYLEDEDEFIPVTYWNFHEKLPAINPDSSLAGFFKRSDWVIKVHEFKENKALYDNLELDQEILDIDDLQLIIPLKHHYRLIGFVMLLDSNAIEDVNWEIMDLLKAVARQISSYLAFIRTTEELNRAQQFNTFNRLSSFIVHDIKNQVSQLDLIVKNAQKFRDNPEFINDAFLTVENVVGRMQRLLGQLKQVRQNTAEAKKVDVEELIKEVVELRKLNQPEPEFISHAQNNLNVTDKLRLRLIQFP